MEDISATQSEHLIKPINKDTVHRICSGQVVLSLAIAMKELVENSIDAGATIIDIHLKEYGSEHVEVQDNGSGVAEENFEALTLKHYTSKIQEFDDLTTLGTLGFRGEALSSLCALSDLVIITKHHSAQTATKITYDRNGKILEKVPVAREQGTTVKLEKLFSTLPVRRKEFMKNVKREFSKMCQLLYAYCLIPKGIKFTCTNITNSGSRSTIAATDGKQTRENIINVFGAKQISTLINVEPITPEDPILTEYDIKSVPEGGLPFSFEFFISSVVHGSGRSTTDRQFYFFNDRPCEPTRLMKLVNEIYRQYNSNQYPFVYLNIRIKSLLIDVNVTPDKRQIFLENEKLLLATIKASLTESFKSFPSSYKMQNLELSQTFSQNLAQKNPPSKGIKRSLTEKSFKKGSLLATFKKKSKTDSFIQDKSSDLSQFIQIKKETYTGNTLCLSEEDSDIEEVDKKLDTLIDLACKLVKEKDDEENIVDISDVPNGITKNIEKVNVTLDKCIKNVHNKKSVPMDISLDSIRKVLEDTQQPYENSIKVKFRSEINPENNKSAEEELRKHITKEDFANMEIIGQFNLGFIITKLNNDLFIIDQHATDEKYNFEQLQQNTVIDSQVLVNPKSLELTAGNECLLMDNLEVFRKNGFSFKIDESAPCTKKVALTAIPVSRNFVFGKEDIDEMLFILQESGGLMCRPSRVRGMFALRACRKSVMIGKALSISDMRKLIDHMGEIEQPWNCPHGRPTMRHLINLDLIQKDDYDRMNF